MRAFMIGVLVFGAGAVAAQEGLRATDTRFTAAELAVALSGRMLLFHDESRASYGADGSYLYAYTATDAPFSGRYETNDDSAVCVTFDNGFSRCDTIVRAGEQLVLITDEGLRFPVKSVSEAE